MGAVVLLGQGGRSGDWIQDIAFYVEFGSDLNVMPKVLTHHIV